MGRQKQYPHGNDYLWLLVTLDEYEFPLYIADNLSEFCETLGLNELTVRSSVSHAESGRKKTSYRRVPKQDIYG